MNMTRENIAAQNPVDYVRPLSDFEKQYVAWRTKPLFIGRRVLGVLGILLTLSGMGLPIGLIADGYHSAQVVGIVFLLGCVMVGMGTLLVRFTLLNKPVPDGKVSRIAGVLKRKETKILNLSDVVIIEYRIDDFLLFFPMAFESLLVDYVNRPVELMATTFAPANPLMLFGKKSIFNGSQTAIVLAFYEHLNIHRAVEKYGIWFIKKDFYFKSASALALAILFAAVDLSISFVSLFAVAGIVAGFVAALILLAFLIDWLQKIAVARGLIKARIPYLEKLKG